MIDELLGMIIDFIAYGFPTIGILMCIIMFIMVIAIVIG